MAVINPNDVKQWSDEIKRNSARWNEIEAEKQKYQKTMSSTHAFKLIQEQHSLHKRNDKLRSYMGYSMNQDTGQIKIIDHKRYNAYLGAIKKAETPIVNLEETQYITTPPAGSTLPDLPEMPDTEELKSWAIVGGILLIILAVFKN